MIKGKLTSFSKLYVSYDDIGHRRY